MHGMKNLKLLHLITTLYLVYQKIIAAHMNLRVIAMKGKCSS